MSEINPQDCLPGVVYRGTVGGEEYIMVRSYPEHPKPWAAQLNECVEKLYTDDQVSGLVEIERRADLAYGIRPPKFMSAEKQLDWVYSREPEFPNYGIHAVTLKREAGDEADVVFPVREDLVSLNTSPTRYRTLDEAEELARAILRVVEDGRKRQVE